MSGPIGDFIVGGLAIAGGILIGLGSGGLAGFAAAGLFSYGVARIRGGIASLREGAEQRIEGAKFNVRSTQAPVPIIYGRTRIGIKVVDTRIVSSADPLTPSADPTALFSGADNNDVLARVGAFALGSEDGSGIQAIDEIRVYEDGVSAVGTPAAFSTAPSVTGIISKYASHLLYILEDGDDAQNTRAELESALGWTANMNGVGIAYGAFFFRYDREVWDKGVPQITARVTGNRVYDPRSLTWINYAASGPSADNPALCLLDYLTSRRYGGAVPYAARDGGPLDLIDEQSFIDAANYCDDLVSIPGATTEKRFRTNAVINTGRVVGANVAEMLVTCRGDLVWEGGLYRLVIRQVTTPATFELTEDNIVGEIEWVRKGADVPNMIEATFPDGANGDFVANSVVWPLTGDTTLLLEDNGVENRVEVELPYTTSYYQALRTIMVMLREARNDVLCSLTATQGAYTLQIGDVVRVTHSGPGWIQETFTVRQVALTPDGLVRLALQQYTAGAYTLDTLVAQPSTPTFNLPAPFRAGVSLAFLYERPQSIGVVSAAQRWHREVSWEVGSNTRSVQVNPANYLVTPTLDSGGSTPAEVALGTYHLDVAPSSHTLHFLRDASRDVVISDFALVDSHILLNDTNNGVAQQVVGDGRELNALTLELQRTGVPTGTMVMRVYDDAAGLPNTLLATSYGIPALSVGTGLNYLVTFPFPTPSITLVSGTVYHYAVEYSAGDASNYIGVGTDNVGAGGGAEVLNGSWANDAAFNVIQYAVTLGGNIEFGQVYDENNIIIGGSGAVSFSLTPVQQGGGISSLSTQGVSTLISGKAILDYDDTGARFFETADRRVDFSGEVFGAPGPGPNDLLMNDVANGFAFDYTPAVSHDLGFLAVYLRRTASPTGTIIARIYDDSGGLPNTLLATSEGIDVATLPTSYPSNDPASNGGFSFLSPASLVVSTLYHVSVEYGGGDAVNFVSVAAESTGTNDELNGAWAMGVANRQLTWRVYAREDLERIARTGLPTGILSARLNFITGNVELTGSSTGGGLDSLTDVVITAPVNLDVLAHNGSNWGDVALTAAHIQSGTFADARIAQSNVTQHQAALALAASQVTSGTFADARIAASNVTQHQAALSIGAAQITSGAFPGAYTIDGSLSIRGTGEVLQVRDNSATGLPQAAWYQDSTVRAYIQYHDSGPRFRFNAVETGSFMDWFVGNIQRMILSNAGILQILGSGSEHLRLNHDSATGSPFMSWYQADTLRALIQYSDSGPVFRFETVEVGAIIDWVMDGAQRMILTDGLLQVIGGGEILRLDDSSATGSPQVTFYQAGTFRSVIQYLDAGDLLLVSNAFGGLSLRAGAGGVATERFALSNAQPYAAITGSGELLRLIDESASGQPYLSFYQTTTRRSFIQHTDAGDYLNLQSEFGGVAIYTQGTLRVDVVTGAAVRVHGITAVDEVLRVSHADAAGGPLISLYQQATQRSYIQHVDAGDSLRLASEYGTVELWPGAAGVEAVVLTASPTLISATVDIQTTGDVVSNIP